MEPNRLMVLTPAATGASGVIETSLAIAGTRAGAIGVLDLEFAANPAAALAAIGQVARFAGRVPGILLRASAAQRTSTHSHLQTNPSERFSPVPIAMGWAILSSECANLASRCFAKRSR